MNAHGDMLKNLLLRLGLKQIVACSNPNIWTSLRTHGNQSVLFLMNLFSAPMEAEVHCQPSWSKSRIDLGVQRLAGMTVKEIELGQG